MRHILLFILSAQLLAGLVFCPGTTAICRTGAERRSCQRYGPRGGVESAERRRNPPRLHYRNQYGSMGPVCHRLRSNGKPTTLEIKKPWRAWPEPITCSTKSLIPACCPKPCGPLWLFLQSVPARRTQHTLPGSEALRIKPGQLCADPGRAPGGSISEFLCKGSGEPAAFRRLPTEGEPGCYPEHFRLRSGSELPFNHGTYPGSRGPPA